MTKVNCTESFIIELYQESKNIKHHVSKQRINAFVEELFQFLFLIDERTCLSKANIEARYEELRYDFISIVDDFLQNEPQKEQLTDYYDCILPTIYAQLKQDTTYTIDREEEEKERREGKGN